jgi:hypothetical protein
MFRSILMESSDSVMIHLNLENLLRRVSKYAYRA